MSTNEIYGSKSLMRQISQLKADKTANEEVIIQSLNEFKQLIFNPVKTLNNDLDTKQSGKREVINLSKVLLNLGTNYIIEYSFGKRQKLNMILTSVMIELISIPLIRKGITKLFVGIDKHIFGETESNI